MAARDTKAMAGIAAAAVALGVTQLLAAFVGPEADARTAVGSAVIDLTPGPVKEWAIQTFGMADKLVLSVLVLVVIAVIAAAHRDVGDAPRPDRQRGDRPGRGGRMCGGAVPRRCDGGGHRAYGGRHRVRGRGAAPAHLRPVHRRTRRADEPDEPDAPDRGRRLSLVTLGLLGAGALTGVGRRRAVPREDVGGR